MFKIVPLLSVLALIGGINCEPDHGPGVGVGSGPGPGGIRTGSGGSSGGYDLPPPPPPADPAPIPDGGPLPPPGPIGGIGGFGFPGLGFGLNAGAGAGISPFLGGIGGNLGIGGGLGGYGGPGGPVGGGGGFLGPSYLPSTWLGSALGAKGDILFPCVIVLFFIVGIWTVINFLLALTVPLIGAKLGFANSITNAFRRKGRSALGDDGEGDEDTEALTQNVTDAIDTEY